MVIDLYYWIEAISLCMDYSVISEALLLKSSDIIVNLLCK